MSKAAKKLKKEQKKAAKKASKIKPKKKISRVKAKKKVWFKVISPRVFGQKEIGESYLSSAQSAVGRKLKVNLKELTGNVRDQNVYINLQINKLDANNLNTSVIGYQIAPAYIKRLVRKNADRIDGYFIFKTKGGKRVILKSLIVTLNKTQRSTKSQLNNELGTLLKEEISKVGFDTFVNDLVHYKIQGSMKKKLRKIFPLKEVAIRVLKLQEKGVVKEEVVVEDKTQQSSETVSSSASLTEPKVPVSIEAPVKVPVETSKETPAEKTKTEATGPQPEVETPKEEATEEEK